MIELIFDPVMLEGLIGFAFAGQITRERQRQIDRAAVQQGGYNAAIALTPSYEDIQAGRNTPAAMEAYIMGDQLPNVTQSIVASAPAAGPHVIPKEVVPAPGEKKRKKKEKKQGLGAGVTGEVPTSVLGSVNITSPQLLGT